MFSRLRKKHLLYGFLVAPAAMIVFVIYSAFLGMSDPAFIESMCSNRSCECTDWHRHSVGSYQVENNVWNKGNIDSYQQCVFINQADHGIDAGWGWNWPGVRFNVVAYPNVTYGKNPWLNTTSPELPLRIDEIDCLEAEFRAEQYGRGKGNLAIDLWITDSASAEPSNITREIMIWLSREGFRPAGSRVDTVVIDGHEIGLWKKEDHKPSEGPSWTFVAFVYRSDLTEGAINFVEFLDHLVDNGHMSPDEYLASIQLGNEIVSGHGVTLVKDFEIRICDR